MRVVSPAVVLTVFLSLAIVQLARAGEGAADATWTDAFAERLYTAWIAGEPMPQLSAAHPEATLEQAYEVQQAFVERMLSVDSIGGFKAAGVGSMDPDSPTTGILLASGVLDATPEVVVDLNDDPTRKIETEIGYVFGSAITEAVPDVATLKEHVSHIVPIVEVPGGATQRIGEPGAVDLVAWNVNAKEIIVGTRHDPAKTDPDRIEITLKREGELINKARGDDAARGQWETLRVTVNRTVRQGYTIGPGHVLTNGALGKILDAAPGRYVAEFGALGKITFDVVRQSR